MIVKFFEYRGSSGKACVEYLIGQNGRREGASVLFGNPVLTANIIDNLKFKRKFTAGCLAIQEKNISKVTTDAIIGCFQSIICTGLWPTQLSFLWVQHLDKENLELNFVIPHVDLISRRSLTPYLRRFDGKYISVFEDFINDSLKISSPRNPFCMLGMAVGKFATAAQKKSKKSFT